MAVLALQLREHYALIAADGAEVEPRSGLITRIRSPIMCLPDRNAILAVSGPRGMAELINLHVPDEVADYDGLLEALPTMLSSALHSSVRHQFGLGTRPPTEVILAGWSSRERRLAAHRAELKPRLVDDLKEAGSRAASAVKMSEIPSAPTWRNFEVEKALVERLELEQDADDDMDRLTRNIFAARLQYATTGASCLRSSAVPGGFIQLAMVSQDLQKSWIAHRWEAETVGAVISDSAEIAVPDKIIKAAPVS